MPAGRIKLTEKQAATRVAMFFEATCPTARPDFDKVSPLTYVKIPFDEFRLLVDRDTYTDRFHEIMCEELFEWSLLLTRAGTEYFLIIGWQNEAYVPIQSHRSSVDAIITETKNWTNEWTLKFNEDWP